MPNRSKYRALDELFVEGTELVFDNGTIMWIQVMNPFEQDEARELSYTARERMVLALEEVGSDEQTRMLAALTEQPRTEIVSQIVLLKHLEWTATAATQVHDDPDWKTRLEVLDRRQEIMSQPDETERELLTQISEDYIREVGRRVAEQEQVERDHLMKCSPGELRDRWLEFYRKRRGELIALAEYQNIESFYSARCCDAAPRDDGTYDHGVCDHSVRVYETKEDFRKASEYVQEQIRKTLTEMAFSARDAKNSDSATGSSGSSALQGPPEESTASTPDATPVAVPGPSKSLSSTP